MYVSTDKQKSVAGEIIGTQRTILSGGLTLLVIHSKRWIEPYLITRSSNHH